MSHLGSFITAIFVAIFTVGPHVTAESTTASPRKLEFKVDSACFGQFACQSGEQCIPFSSVCNGKPDCFDGSDESNCVFVTPGVQVVTYNVQVYLSDLCASSQYASMTMGRTVSASSSSVIIKASPNSYIHNSTCTLTVTGPDAYNITSSVREINVRSDCVDNLTLSDKSKKDSYIYCTNGIDSKEKNTKTFFESVVLQFKTGSIAAGPILGRTGFQVTLTVYRAAPCYSNYEFRCSNTRCISTELKCDGHNHCGDNSDQKGCSSSGQDTGSKLTTGQSVGLALGILITAGILGGVYWYLRRRQ